MPSPGPTRRHPSCSLIVFCFRDEFSVRRSRVGEDPARVWAAWVAGPLTRSGRGQRENCPRSARRGQALEGGVDGTGSHRSRTRPLPRVHLLGKRTPGGDVFRLRSHSGVRNLFERIMDSCGVVKITAQRPENTPNANTLHDHSTKPQQLRGSRVSTSGHTRCVFRVTPSRAGAAPGSRRAPPLTHAHQPPAPHRVTLRSRLSAFAYGPCANSRPSSGLRATPRGDGGRLHGTH